MNWNRFFDKYENYALISALPLVITIDHHYHGFLTGIGGYTAISCLVLLHLTGAFLYKKNLEISSDLFRKAMRKAFRYFGIDPDRWG